MHTIKQAVEKYTNLISKARKYIWDNPEVGFKEFKTNEYMISAFENLGYKIKRQKDITGFTCYFDTGKKGPTVLVLAELDALYCKEHKNSDKETGAVHCCGHDMQCASILGVASAIKEKTISEKLCGKVKFCIVPAEEGIEISYRQELVNKGVISFTSGKPEFISRGMLDDVDIAFMIHVENLEAYNGAIYGFSTGSNGVIRKKTIITGKASHAGAAPWGGVNALYAAQLSFSACNALRETFKDEDHIRFHSIITKGGEVVNAIPDKVVIESYVRASNSISLKQTNNKINRAICGACLALGAEVEISDVAGSEPLYNNLELTKLMQSVSSKITEKENYAELGFLSSSTDMGDVSSLVPSVHAYVDGHRGLLHGKDYCAFDPVKSCLNSAILQLATICELLKDNGKIVYKIKDEFTPIHLSVQDYLNFKKNIAQKQNCIEYQDKNIIINLK